MSNEINQKPFPFQCIHCRKDIYPEVFVYKQAGGVRAVHTKCETDYLQSKIDFFHKASWKQGDEIIKQQSRINRLEELLREARERLDHGGTVDELRDLTYKIDGELPPKS